MRRWTVLAPLAVFLLLAIAFFWRIERINQGEMPNEIPTVLLDRDIPPFDLPSPLPNIGGASSEALKGKVVLVNFFASWCVPCRTEHALLAQLAEKVMVVGLVYKDTPQAARRYLAQLGNPYQALGMVDELARTAIDFGVTGVPESYLIDRQGHIRYAWKKPFTPEEIKTRLLPLVAELSR